MKIKYIIYCTTIVLLAACSSSDEPPYALFDTARSSYFAGDEIKMNNKSNGEGVSYTWHFGDGQTSTEASPIVVYTEPGGYTIKLTVSGEGGTSEHKRLINIDQPARSVGEIDINWLSGKTFGYIQATSPAVDLQGNVVIASADNILRKFSKVDGSQMWEFNLWNPADGTLPTGATLAVPSIDTDGTIYMGTGNGTNGRFYAINSDGTKKWMVPYGDNGFWAASGTPNPKINHLNAAIGDNSIYIGNGGTTGSVLAIDKTTGYRKAYVANNSNGGPGGGVSSGVLLDNKNRLFWQGGIYGLFRASASKMEIDARVNWDWRFYTYAGEESINSAMAIGSDGTIYGLANFKTVGKVIFALDGNATEEWPKAKWYCALESVGSVDQGGVAIGADGTIYSGLKRAVGTEGGGIVAVNPDGSIRWRYGIPQDVSGTPAIDQAGNIHFATDGGQYYILSSDGTTEIFLSDLAELIIRKYPEIAAKWAVGQTKCWNSPVIDSDGTIYIGVTNMENDKRESVLLSLKHKSVTGPANSVWPMRGQNAQRTNRQPN